MPPTQVILSLIGIVIIIAGAYYATYYISVKASGQKRGRAQNRNRSIVLLERFAIAKDKSFCLVEVAGKVYVVGVTNQSITLLDTLDAEELAEHGAAGAAAAASSRNVPQNGPFGNKLMNRLTVYMAGKMAKSRGTGEGFGKKADVKASESRRDDTAESESGESSGADDRSFEDSMRAAREEQEKTEKQGGEADDRPDDPEV